ncbi:MAG: hypothetical protein JJ949_11460 [Roseicyclus sp.]|nr:hypothetical protein [Roseicyclus sp.]MBO6922374.1 hypothetical protein [Roseicyclus sp.]
MAHTRPGAHLTALHLRCPRVTMPFLEIVSFAGTTLAAVVLVIAMALIACDGLAALISGLLVCAIVGTTGIMIVGN